MVARTAPLTESETNRIAYFDRVRNWPVQLVASRLRWRGNIMSRAQKKLSIGREWFLAALIGDWRDLKPMPRAEWADHNCWLYSVLCRNEAGAISLAGHMKECGIEARGFWRSLSAQKPYADAPNYLATVSRDITGRVVSLPCSSSLTEIDQSRVSESLAGWRNIQ